MIWDEIKKRSLAKSKTQFTEDMSAVEALFLASPCDLGVCRNGGRRGASLAPKAIMNVVENMAYTQHFPKYKAIQIGFQKEENLNFDQSQTNQQNRIKEAMTLFPGRKTVHLGGGHDHVYPLLAGLRSFTKNITIINIDAHLDTRTDMWNHSGTPFRQASALWSEGNFQLIQIGIHAFSNPHSNYRPLPHGQMKIYSENEWNLASGHIENLIDPSNELIILSLDCDALCSSFMEGVSAVNPDGLSLNFMQEAIRSYLKWTEGKRQIFGIYEYNPVYDNTSQKGAKALGALIHQFLEA